MQILQVAYLNQCDFEQDSTLDAVAHFDDGLVEHLQSGQQRHGSPGFAPFLELLHAIGIGRSNQIGAATHRHRHHVSQITEQLFGKLPNIYTLIGRRIEFSQGTGRIALDQTRCERCESRLVRGSQHGVNDFDGDSVAAEAQQLLKQRLAVSHRSGCAAGD